MLALLLALPLSVSLPPRPLPAPSSPQEEALRAAPERPPTPGPTPSTERTGAQDGAKPAAAPKGPPPLLMRGATVHSMRPGDPPRVEDLLVVEGRIRALGPEAASETDPAPRVIDVHGKHLVPGLIDAHVNFDPEHDALYLAAGVTLVRDLGGDRVTLLRERGDDLRDRVPGPALLTAGAALDGDPPAAASAVVLRSPEAAEGYLPILFEEGVDFLSVLPGLPHETWRRVITLAHGRELKVFGPRPIGASLAEALEAGQDGFHAIDSLLPVGVGWPVVDSESIGEAVVALADSKRPLVPLLHPSALRLEDQEEEPAPLALAALLAPSYEAWWRMELRARRPFLTDEHRGPGELVLEKQARAARALFDAGASLLPGSGAPQPWCMPGTALHQELAQWVRAGIPPAAVLQMATRGAAEALGLAGQRGTLEPGAWADVLVLDQDPEGDLARLLDPAWVVVRGIPVSRQGLRERLDALASHQAATRQALAAPVEVEPPPQGEEGVVILEGTVQTDSFGSRISTERYRVVRISDDVLLFTTRVAYPPTAGGKRELTLEQFVRNGRLDQVHATLTEGGRALEHDGLWTAGTWRMQTRLGAQIIDSPAPFDEQPACVDADCAVTCLILGQLPESERIPVVQLHEAFDTEPVYWRLEVDEQGTHKVRTQVGYRAFRLDTVGAIEFGLTKVGVGLLETRALSSSAFGGAGLPLPASKRVGQARAVPAAQAEVGAGKAEIPGAGKSGG